MSRPLLITDCDEVLLHMAAHFRDWLQSERGIDFLLGESSETTLTMRRQSDGSALSPEESWPLFDQFFATEMHRQTLVPHAADALIRIDAVADIVILTNLGDHCHAQRVEQLAALGIRHRVMCNQGGKGRAVTRLIEEYRPSASVFVDDIPTHHASVARHAPDVWRLHMVAEPILAPHIPRAPEAHARIDDWAEAVQWVLAKLG
jgi:hypothetical protein